MSREEVGAIIRNQVAKGLEQRKAVVDLLATFKTPTGVVVKKSAEVTESDWPTFTNAIVALAGE